MRARHALCAAVAACATGLLATGVACSQILGINDGHPRDAGVEARSDALGEGAASDAAFSVYCANLWSDAGCPSGSCSCEGGILGESQNCGYCGHDCLGGQCMGGQCQPVQLYMEPREPSEAGTEGGGVPNIGADVLGVLDGYVYWYYPDLNGVMGSVRRLVIDGGSVPETLVHTSAKTASAMDETGIYNLAAGSDMTIYHLPLDGGTNMSVGSLLEQASEPAQIVVDGTQLYIADGTRDVLALSKNGGPPVPVSVMESRPAEIATASPFLGWLDLPWLYGADASTSFVEAELQSGIWTVTARLLLDPDHVGGLATDGTYYYWFDVTQQALYRLPVGALNMVADAGPEQVGGTLGGDAGPVSYARRTLPQGGGAIACVVDSGPLLTLVAFCPGKPPVVLARPPQTQFHAVYGRVVDDGVSVYWGTYTGLIWRLAK